MADVINPQATPDKGETPQAAPNVDIDPQETAEWIESLDYVIRSKGQDRAKHLIETLERVAKAKGVDLPYQHNTPYINTIPADQQSPYPGNRELERRIKSIIRWNAMAMVV